MGASESRSARRPAPPLSAGASGCLKTPRFATVAETQADNRGGDSAGVLLLPRRLSSYFSSSLPKIWCPSALRLFSKPLGLLNLLQLSSPSLRVQLPQTRALHPEVGAPGPDRRAEAASWTGFKGDCAWCGSGHARLSLCAQLWQPDVRMGAWMRLVRDPGVPL